MKKDGQKSWWQRTKAWLYPAVKKRKRAALEKNDKGSSDSLSSTEFTDRTIPDSSSEIHLDLEGGHTLPLPKDNLPMPYLCLSIHPCLPYHIKSHVAGQAHLCGPANHQENMEMLVGLLKSHACSLACVSDRCCAAGAGGLPSLPSMYADEPEAAEEGGRAETRPAEPKVAIWRDLPFPKPDQFSCECLTSPASQHHT